MNEMLDGQVVALGVAVILSIRWLIKGYTDHRIKVTTSDIDVKLLLKRVSNLEEDLKATAVANLALSQAFHAEINKILHRLSGDSNG